MRHISPATAALAAILTTLACPLPVLSQAVSVNLTGTLTDPAICDGVVYFGSDNGKLYAINAADGTSATGFPVDLGAAAGDGSVPNYHTRPGVYYGSLGKAIYVETSKHGVVKIWPGGTVAWINKLDGALPYGDYCTPAVTPQGEVIAETITQDNVFIVKLKESDGALLMTSPPLGEGNISAISSPAVANGNIYVTLWPYPAAGRHNHVAVLNLADLAVKASFQGSGYDKTALYVRGAGVFVGSSAQGGATVFKLNSSTLAPDPGFGPGLYPSTIGVTWTLPADGGVLYSECEVGASPSSTDRDAGGSVYASVGYPGIARVVAISATSGAVRVLYNTGSQGGPGLVVSPNGVIAYGVDKTLKLISVDGGVLKSYDLPGYPSRPCYDPTTNRFFVTTQPDSTGASYLLGFDSP